MKKILLALFLCGVLFFGANAATPENPMLKIGLFYNTTALPSANLQNAVGSGYALGQFDSARNFTALFNISETRISMLSDMNFYHYDATFYQSGAPANSQVIGAFHLQLLKEYYDIQDAVAMATSLQLRGHEAFPAWQSGHYVVRVGHYTNLAAANSAAQANAIGEPAIAMGNGTTTITVVNTVSGKILFELDGTLGIKPLGEVPITWFKGYKYYGGFEYSRNAGNITVCNVVSMQDYVKGVLPYEMSASWPQEALRAQAMCARTYAYAGLNKHGTFDLCNSTHCQVYRGTNSASANSDLAVDSTYGMYILYDGKPISAVYHSSNGGATEDSENVWGGTNAYLRGVRDPYEDLDAATNGRWSEEYTGEEIQSILNSKGYEIGKVVDVRPTYTAMGNMLSMTFVDAAGKTVVVQKSNTRSILNSDTLGKHTHSQRFTIAKKGSVIIPNPSAPSAGGTLFVNFDTYALPLTNQIAVVGKNGRVQTLANGDQVAVLSATGTSTYPVGSGGATTTVPQTSGNANAFVVNGTGWGHNVGMSQNGAKGMANQGFTGEEIIHFYYTDITISNT
ncbi:MAG: SpoIID/LytB domain-containing protein [Ruminococcaceae bacterium]|nr:SpoIID/LytB domain-containing protein [Oscillospiraceae bacterium]